MWRLIYEHLLDDVPTLSTLMLLIFIFQGEWSHKVFISFLRIGRGSPL